VYDDATANCNLATKYLDGVLAPQAPTPAKEQRLLLLLTRLDKLTGHLGLCGELPSNSPAEDTLLSIICDENLY